MDCEKSKSDNAMSSLKINLIGGPMGVSLNGAGEPDDTLNLSEIGPHNCKSTGNQAQHPLRRETRKIKTPNR
jgi:hypothetical protein